MDDVKYDISSFEEIENWVITNNSTFNPENIERIVLKNNQIIIHFKTSNFLDLYKN